MGNIISFNGSVSQDDALSISNGLTDVLIDYLLLSGSELAETESEKRIIIFLAEKQQSVIGLGNADFAMTDIPWDTETFESDKEFMLQVTDYAKELSARETTSEELGYHPDKKMLEYALNGFERLIKRMTVSAVDKDNLKEWFSDRDADDPVICGYPKCEKHGIFLSMHGCKFCNDGVPKAKTISDYIRGSEIKSRDIKTDILLSVSIAVLFVSTIFLSNLISIKLSPLEYVYIIFVALLYGMGMVSRDIKHWILKWVISIPFSYLVIQFFWKTDFSLRALNWVLKDYGKESAGGRFAGFIFLCFQFICCFISGIASIVAGKILTDHGRYEKNEKKQVIAGIAVAVLIVIIVLFLEMNFPSAEYVNAMINS